MAEASFELPRPTMLEGVLTQSANSADAAASMRELLERSRFLNISCMATRAHILREAGVEVVDEDPAEVLPWCSVVEFWMNTESGTYQFSAAPSSVHGVSERRPASVVIYDSTMCRSGLQMTGTVQEIEVREGALWFYRCRFNDRLLPRYQELIADERTFVENKVAAYARTDRRMYEFTPIHSFTNIWDTKERRDRRIPVDGRVNGIEFVHLSTFDPMRQRYRELVDAEAE